MSTREAHRLITAHRQREGGGFVVRRPFPTQELDYVDPFLLLDEMGPVTYAPGEAVGAPDHPHRGFETVTYMLDGEFEHEDSAGHRGSIRAGDVQWMTAGDGVIHAEMPAAWIKEKGGRVHGFQIWVNLPAKFKRIAPRYQDVRAEAMPTWHAANDRASVKVVAGNVLGIGGAAQTHWPITYLDVALEAETEVTFDIAAEQNVMVYTFAGGLRVGDQQQIVNDGQLALLAPGDSVRLTGNLDGSRALVLGGRPIHEAVARHGPFVMNTREEVMEAIDDYRSGRFNTISR